MKLSILHTSARPNDWRKAYEAWIAAAAHPENVEYVLCVDKRWGFTPTSMAHFALQSRKSSAGQDLDILCWNSFPYRHSGYVSGVNETARHSTGDMLVVIADDLFPCPNRDEKIIRTTRWLSPIYFGYEWVIWISTNTPTEFERNIMVAPILSRSRYERVGYVLYPKYESMYSDNDFAEHAQMDQEEERCVIIRGHFSFDHRHPFFDPEQMDDVYRAQNDPRQYELGKRMLEARRVAKFGEVADIFTRRRIAILAPGETFSRRWLIGWTDLISGWGAAHDAVVSFPFATNVYICRAAAAKNILELAVAPDFVLWIDDDNPPFLQFAEQLLRDLEANPEVDLVAGWCLTEDGKASFGSTADGKRLDADLEQFHKGPELQRIDWTGFPMVLMRYSLLADVGYRAFLPQSEDDESDTHNAYGWLGEDIGFCKRAIEKGHVLLVNRRVKLEHLKLQDVPARALAAPSAHVPQWRGTCNEPGCQLAPGHPGRCYPGTADETLRAANVSPIAQRSAREANEESYPELL